MESKKSSSTKKKTTKEKPNKQLFCSTHKKGPFNIDSILLKEHEAETTEKCKLVKFNPKRHNEKYELSNPQQKHQFHFVKGNEETTQTILDKNIQNLRPQTLLSDGTKIILVYIPTQQKTVKGTGDNITTSYKYLNSAYFVICDKKGSKKILPYNQEELVEKYRIKVLSEWNDVRWDVSDLKEWEIQKGKTDPEILYKLLNKTTRNYLEYASESEYTKFNLWNIATYFFELFDSFPYNDYTGIKRAGKTKSLIFQKLVCYNPIMSADISSSATFRIIEGIGATLLLDETESFKDKKNDNAQALRTLLIQGFLKDQYAVRNDTTKDNNYTPTQYNLYSPKSMAHINTFDDVLEERCIKQILIRSLNEDVKNTWCSDEDKTFSEIRNLCYRLFLDHADEISSLKNDARKLLGVNSRELQLWTPLITMALFFEKHGIPNLVRDIQISVSQSSENRQIEDEQESRELRILSFLDKTGVILAKNKECIGDNPLHWIPISLLYNELTNRSSEYEIPEWFARKHLTNALEKLGFKQGRKRGGISWFITRNSVDEIKERMGVNDKDTTLDNFDSISKSGSQGSLVSQTSHSGTKSTDDTESTNFKTSQTSHSKDDSGHKSEENEASEQNEVKTNPPQSSRKREQGEASEVSKNHKTSQDSQHTHFRCKTCNAGEFLISSKDILEFHKKQDHIIFYFTKEGLNQ